MVQYLNALQAYQDDVTIIQNEYKNQMSLYESQAEVYQAQMEDYQEQFLTYEAARNKAVQSAEGIIDGMNEQYDWAYVNKSDTAGFRRWLTVTWGAQLALVGVFIAVILVLIKRKDTKR
jgi:hypothetical protein